MAGEPRRGISLSLLASVAKEKGIAIKPGLKTKKQERAFDRSPPPIGPASQLPGPGPLPVFLAKAKRRRRAHVKTSKEARILSSRAPPDRDRNAALTDGKTKDNGKQGGG